MTGSLRALVVEDDPSLRDVLQEVLTDQGWHVVVAARGEDALQRAREESFDLILADIRMEGISGLDTIEQARELQPDIGSIVVSGFASEEETLRAVRLNVAGYLKKPFKMSELMELVGKFLSEREERLRRDRETRASRQAFLWLLQRWGASVDRDNPGQVLRGAELAHGLALTMGFPEELAHHLSLGTMLRGLDALDPQDFPDEVLVALEAFPLLANARNEQTAAELVLFAHRLGQNVAPDQAWPSAEAIAGVEAGISEPLLQAYTAYRSGGGPPEPSTGEYPHGLLSLGRTLEHAADWEGAERAYAGARELAGSSSLGLRALLGLARLAVARGQTGSLESAIAELLRMAETLGPVSLALAELEGAESLRRAGHPAAGKLFGRALQSLTAVGLGLPWARAALALASLGLEAEPALLKRAVAQLSHRSHRWEVLQQLESLLGDLLDLAASEGAEETTRLGASALVADLARDCPEDVAEPLRRGRLSLPARQALLRLLEGEVKAVSGSLLDALQGDSEEAVRHGALSLAAKLGRSENRPVLRVSSLGTLEVRWGDTRLDDKAWKTQKTKYLFARLVENAPRGLAVDRLMEDFWPGPVEGARNNLNTAVSSLRRLLGPSRASLDPIVRNAETLALDPGITLWHDADELERSAIAAQRHLEAGHLDGAMTHFARVVRLYGGPFLDGCYMDWAVERRHQVENRLAFALEQLARHRMDQHRYREALEYALALLVVQPDNGAAHDIVMRGYMALDQHQKAVEHYDAYTARLAQEESEPDLELLRTYQMARYGFQQSHGLSLD